MVHLQFFWIEHWLSIAFFLHLNLNEPMRGPMLACPQTINLDIMPLKKMQEAMAKVVGDL